jgi:RNA polymerase sigma factor (sigma-70 family)
MAEAVSQIGAAADLDLDRFHAGDRQVLAGVYRRHVDAVERVACCYCRGADAENIVHDVFATIIERREVREQFKGGDIAAWLRTMTKNRAIDLLRRRKRETLLGSSASIDGLLEPIDEELVLLDRDEAERLQRALERFEQQVLPTMGKTMAEIFKLRFRQGLSQVETAERAGVPRTTLISREQRLVGQLGRFLKKALGS